MHYEDVSSTEELNQKVADYMAFGYKVKNKSSNYARLVKNDFSWGIFIILLFFLIIGAIIYWAVKSGNKDEIIIRVKNDTPKNTSSDAVKYCVKCGGAITSEKSQFCPNCGIEINDVAIMPNNCEKCGTINNEDSKFCEKCGEPLNQNETTTKPQEPSANMINCPFCGKEIPKDSKQCKYCGMKVRFHQHQL